MKRTDDVTKLRAEREAARRKQAEIAEGRNEAERKEAELLAALNGRSKERSNHLADEVQRILHGDNHEPTRPSIDSLREQSAQAHQSVQAHKGAYQFQQRLVEEVNLRYSKVVCAAKEAEWFKLGKTTVDAAAALAKAFQAIEDFRSALVDDGVIITLPDLPPHLNALGNWNNPNSNIHQTISEAIRAGFTKADEYKQPTVPGVYDDLPEAATVAAIAAGPDGIREVQVGRGGKLTTTKWVYKPEQKHKAKPDDWTH